MEIESEEMAEKYFLDALHLFHGTQWLYNTPVTEILAANVLDRFPEGWLDALGGLEYDELNEFVVKKATRPEWSSTLKAFVEMCVNINRLPVMSAPLSVDLPRNFTIGLNNKKQHEIIHLARLVHNECQHRDIDVIVDFGAGLGYVCQLLHHLYGYRVLGLEKSRTNVRDAKSRQGKLYPSSMDHVKYVCCDITNNSAQTIESILVNEFPGSMNVCLIGLHACGDLSIHASKIFRDMRPAKVFIMIPCCYHKFTIERTTKTNVSNETQHFHSFPLSRSFRNAIDKFGFDTAHFLRQPFLRLASQEPADRWNNMSKEAHDKHSFHVLARAVLELYARRNGLSLTKRVQKATRLSQCADFQTYIKDTLLRYKLEPAEEHKTEEEILADEICKREMHEDRIKRLWEQFHEKRHVAEIYTGLQQMLQAPAESLVLQDRLCWMQEQGFDATIVPVMNNCLSPRFCAIVSQKNDDILK